MNTYVPQDEVDYWSRMRQAAIHHRCMTIDTLEGHKRWEALRDGGGRNAAMWAVASNRSLWKTLRSPSRKALACERDAEGRTLWFYFAINESLDHFPGDARTSFRIDQAHLLKWLKPLVGTLWQTHDDQGFIPSLLTERADEVRGIVRPRGRDPFSAEFVTAIMNDFPAIEAWGGPAEAQDKAAAAIWPFLEEEAETGHSAWTPKHATRCVGQLLLSMKPSTIERMVPHLTPAWRGAMGLACYLSCLSRGTPGMLEAPMLRHLWRGAQAAGPMPSRALSPDHPNRALQERMEASFLASTLNQSLAAPDAKSGRRSRL